MFSGSYDPADVIFLLRPVAMEFTPVDEKERLIQSGARHYSEMLSPEWLPPPQYLDLFHSALAQNRERFARDLMRLAARIAWKRPAEIALVSLARAGTPVGALLKRGLDRLGRPSVHYSLSLIRDRGIDRAALRAILARHPASSLVFVDGWTGKGVMARELARALEDFAISDGVRLEPDLFVISDLSGTAAESATVDDYLIPNSLLGATISGLVSRSILNAQSTGPEQFHGCVYHEEFTPQDLSRWFLDDVAAAMNRVPMEFDPAMAPVSDELRREQQVRSRRLLEHCAAAYGVTQSQHIKPGIGESTRVLLRRVPSLVLIREGADERAICHLRELARQRNVPVESVRDLQYEAVALIRDITRGES